jgi:hypothetical protein
MNLEQHNISEPFLLSENEERLFVNEFSNLFSDIFEKKPNKRFPYVRSLSFFQEKLEEIIKNKDKNLELNSKTQTKLLTIFFEELTKFIKNKSQTEEENKLNFFINEVYELFFSYTPNIFSLLPDSEKIKTGTLLTENPQLINGIGQNLIAETIYFLNYGSAENIEKIIDELKRYSLIQQINFLDYIETILISSKTHYPWAKNISSTIRTIIDKLGKEKNSPILRYKIDSVSHNITFINTQYISSLIKDRSLQEIRAKKDKTAKQTQENEYYQERVFPQTKTKQYTLEKISSDSLGLFDHSNLLSEIALVDISEIDNTPPKTRHDLIKTIQTNIKRSRYKRLEVKAEALYFLIEKILKKSLKKEEFEEKMKPLFEIFPKEQLIDFLFSYERLYLSSVDIEKKLKTLKTSFYEQKIDTFIKISLENIKKLQEISPFIEEEELKRLNQPYSNENRISIFQTLKEKYQLALIQYKTKSAILETAEKPQRFDFNEKLLQEFETNTGPFKIIENQYKTQFEELKSQEYPEQKNDEYIISKSITLIEEIFSQTENYLLEILKELEKVTNSKKPKIIFKQTSTTLNNPDVFIKENTDTHKFSLLLRHLHTPSIKERIEKDLEIDLSKISLRSQIQLLDFLSEVNAEIFQELKTALNSPLIKDKNKVLESFLLCGEDFKAGFAIIKLAKSESSNQIFQKITELFGLIDEQKINFRKEQDSKFKINKSLYNRTVIKKALQLVVEISSNKSKDEKDILLKLETFEKSITDWGALFKASRIVTFEETKILEEEKDIEISLVEGGNLIQLLKETGETPTFPNEYKFGIKEYEFLKRNIENSYDSINPQLSKIALLETIKSLNDPRTILIKIRNKRNGEIVGMCKIIPSVKGYEFGTHYVDPTYQGAFGIGDSLQKIALSLIPEGNEVIAEVILSNPSIVRHIEIFEGIGTRIRNLNTQGGFLMEFKWNYSNKYDTKDKKRYSREKIISIINQNTTNNKIQVFKLDTSVGKEKEVLERAEQLFSKGFVLTRIFYENEKNENKRENTIMVFEKI